MNESVNIVMEKATAVALFGYLDNHFSMNMEQILDAKASIAQSFGAPVMKCDKGAGNH